MASKKLLIIDTDCGVDDALAILLAATHPSCDIKAITCCFGNTSLDNACSNVFRVLKTCGRTEVPVFSGCRSSLLGDGQKEATHHGSDGFGNIASTIPVDECKVQKEYASAAMISLVNQHPNEIILVALGPLTNLALAIRMEPSFSAKLKQLVFMGGNINATGNVSSAAEFNFFSDPESAFIVLREFQCPKLCIPWETCVDNPLSWETYAEVMAIDTKLGCFLKQLTQQSAQNCRNRRRTGYHSCDFYAMAVVLQQDAATLTKSYYTTVELHGTHTRGQMVIERRPWITTPPNVDIVLTLDLAKVANIMRTMLK